MLNVEWCLLPDGDREGSGEGLKQLSNSTIQQDGEEISLWRVCKIPRQGGQRRRLDFKMDLVSIAALREIRIW